MVCALGSVGPSPSSVGISSTLASPNLVNHQSVLCDLVSLVSVCGS